MEDFKSKYSGEQVEDLLDKVANGSGDNVYVFNPEGTPSEEYAGLQDAVNNGKQVVVDIGDATPILCYVQYEFYESNSYYIIMNMPHVDFNNSVASVVYNAINVSQTSIDFLGAVESPIILGIDDALDINSTNPVQNKVICEALGVVSEQANSKQEQLVSGTNIKTINGESILGSGDITISGGGSYVPMPETFIEQHTILEHTLSPNSSLYAFLIGDGSVKIYLQEPSSFDVVNEYTMIFRTFGFGNAITINKTIIWANGKSPVLSDSANEIIEISVKCINSPMYDGIQYLGTWAKYETISTDPT